MKQILRYKIHISGRVQGVGFRWSAATEARDRNINGYVKNLPDGGVYIEAEGLREELDAFVEWCKKGPGLSVVENVNIESAPPVSFKDFRIEH